MFSLCNYAHVGATLSSLFIVLMAGFCLETLQIVITAANIGPVLDGSSESPHNADYNYIVSHNSDIVTRNRTIFLLSTK